MDLREALVLANDPTVGALARVRGSSCSMALREALVLANESTATTPSPHYRRTAFSGSLTFWLRASTLGKSKQPMNSKPWLLICVGLLMGVLISGFG